MNIINNYKLEPTSVYEGAVSATYEVDGVKYITDSVGVAHSNAEPFSIPKPDFITINIMMSLLAILVFINVIRLIKMVISDNN